MPRASMKKGGVQPFFQYLDFLFRGCRGSACRISGGAESELARCIVRRCRFGAERQIGHILVTLGRLMPPSPPTHDDAEREGQSEAVVFERTSWLLMAAGVLLCACACACASEHPGSDPHARADPKIGQGKGMPTWLGLPLSGKRRLKSRSGIDPGSICKARHPGLLPASGRVFRLVVASGVGLGTLSGVS